MRFINLIVVWMVIGWGPTNAQTNPIYENLPIGRYKVGFKIITITDDSRVSLPEYNYMGERNEGDRTKKITIHLWYPAAANSGNRTMTYGEYCYNHLRSSTNEFLTEDQKNGQLRSRRTSVDRWFGNPSDAAWEKLLETPMLAQPEATPIQEQFPMLIGILRPLSTSITNEMLASNGYVVAMLPQGNFSISAFAEGALNDIPSMQWAIRKLKQTENIDERNIGTFGFSGSGFTQVLFAMYDYRIKSVADIESGIYMEDLFQPFSASNYYNPTKLRVPFLHIFSRDLSKQEKFINEFEIKTKFSERYRLLLNQTGLHHWDFAAEGYTSCLFLGNRGAAQSNIQKSFELSNMYLLNFFNATLKADQRAEKFLSNKPSLPNIQADLWDIEVLSALKPAPSSAEFESIIRTKGIGTAVDIVNNTIKNDSSTNIRQGFVLNNLGFTFLREKYYAEAIGIFRLNTELHPENANLHDSLAEGYEAAGDTGKMKKTSQVVLDLLGAKTALTTAEQALREIAERRLKQ